MVRHKYCTHEELALHNHEGSLWVAVFGLVLDLTDLVSKNSGDETRAIVEGAGQDISHWFVKNSEGKAEFKTYTHPVTLLTAPFLPVPHHNRNINGMHTSDSGNNSKILHVPPPCPRSDFGTDFGDPWWQNQDLVIARLTSQPRKIKIINTLTSQEHILDVCGEETLEDIKGRYMVYNKHANSYSWKRFGVELDMRKTLSENGIKDEKETFAELQVNDEFYIPAIHLYFVDDLTID